MKFSEATLLELITKATDSLRRFWTLCQEESRQSPVHQADLIPDDITIVQASVKEWEEWFAKRRSVSGGSAQATLQRSRGAPEDTDRAGHLGLGNSEEL